MNPKIYMLLSLTATFCLAFTAFASASAPTSPTGTVFAPTLELESEGHVTVDTKFGTEPKPASCKWQVAGAPTSFGKGKPIVIPLTTLTFTSCTNQWHMTAVSPGQLEIEGTTGYDGTVTWRGMTVIMTWVGAGFTCNYIAENLDVGTFTGGTPATLDLEGSLVLESGSPLCGETPRQMTGSLKVTSPSAFFVDKATTSLTAPTGTVATPTINAESEGHVGIDHPLATFECQWGFQGETKSHAGGSAVVSLTSLTTSSCTDSWHATTVTPGKLEISGTSGYDATVIWSDGTIETTRLGTTCRYKSANTHLGTLTSGSPATIHIEGTLPFHSGSALCGEEAHPLTGSFKVTSPTSLFADQG